MLLQEKRCLISESLLPFLPQPTVHPSCDPVSPDSQANSQGTSPQFQSVQGSRAVQGLEMMLVSLELPRFSGDVYNRLLPR